MKTMVFNVVKVVRVEPGAELDGTVYDQWLHIEYDGCKASIFDQMMIAPEHASGELHELKISVMATSVEPANGQASGISGNRFTGKIVAVRESDGLFEHLLDIHGLRIHLVDTKQHPVGEYLAVKGRLDLNDIQSPSPNAWDPV